MMDLLLQINFTNLSSPSVFDSSLAFLISILFGVMVYSGSRLRSPAIFATFAISVVVLVMTFITALPFIWFWIMVMLDALIIGISASVRFLMT